MLAVYKSNHTTIKRNVEKLTLKAQMGNSLLNWLNLSIIKYDFICNILLDMSLAKQLCKVREVPRYIDQLKSFQHWWNARLVLYSTYPASAWHKILGTPDLPKQLVNVTRYERRYY